MSKPASRTGKRRRVFMQRIANRDGGWKCFYCGRKLTPVGDARSPIHQKDPDRPTMDHRTPRSQGGRSILANLVLSCNECNQDKADTPRTADEAT
jgi:5-methylcytosine-specific restriction endonuclease McrA